MKYCLDKRNWNQFYRGEEVKKSILCYFFIHHYHPFGPSNPLGRGKDYKACCRCLGFKHVTL